MRIHATIPMANGFVTIELLCIMEQHARSRKVKIASLMEDRTQATFIGDGNQVSVIFQILNQTHFLNSSTTCT
jgi:hypothetical protein